MRQEIRGQGYQAAFSQRSDIYAFGCILYHLCTLEDPHLLDNIKPEDVPADYSMSLLYVVSSMLSTNPDERPTASQVKEQLAAIALRLFQAAAPHCPVCSEAFPSKNQLSQHQKKTGYKRHTDGNKMHSESIQHPVNGDAGLRIRGAANAALGHHHDINATQNGAAEPPACIVCRRHFNKKKQFFSHIHGANHIRNPRYVAKRRAETNLDVDVDKEDSRFIKWMRTDMVRHD
jgi:serine/threonine protein kinase